MDVITKKDIVQSLKKLGLEKGDSVIVHSALSSIGKVAGGADTVIEALLETVGVQGTVMVPTFGSKDKVFDPKKSETNLGIIPQAFWKRKDALRSWHPLASVAAIGAKAKWFVEGHEAAKIAHGHNSPYTKLAEVGGKMLLLGVDQDRNTCLHTAEELARLPYLKTAKASYLAANGKTVAKACPYFPGPHRNFIGLQSWLESSGLVSSAMIGSAVARLMPVKPLLAALLKRLKNEPSLFISENPNLADGIWQNADILRAQLNREAFTLAADSQYAGRYLEEAADNLKRFGIDNIVLSFVNGVAWNHIDSKTRKWHLQGLRLASIRIAAIKLTNPAPDDVVPLVKEAKAGAVIVASTVGADIIGKIASSKVKVYVENIRISANSAVKLMNSLSNVQIAFNPLEFVQVGENPFLQTYTRTSVKRHIGLMYINDGLATGQRTNLENGLAETKELISILRCKSFNGLFVLQSPDCESFGQNARSFMAFLKELGECPAK
jgi:aminoglycoside 3-N-acetyltransferase